MPTISIGITGGIGSGKSTVAQLVEAFGYPVFYSDTESKKLLQSPAVLQELSGLFGESILDNGTIDKVALANIVFSDKAKLEQLNKVMHPKVREAFTAWKSNQNSSLVFNEAAILFETGAYQNFDYTLLVTADEELRIQRVMARDSVSKEAVLSRMQKQWPDEDKKKLADFVIVNNNEALTSQVHRVIDELLTKVK